MESKSGTACWICFYLVGSLEQSPKLEKNWAAAAQVARGAQSFPWTLDTFILQYMHVGATAAARLIITLTAFDSIWAGHVI